MCGAEELGGSCLMKMRPVFEAQCSFQRGHTRTSVSNKQREHQWAEVELVRTPVYRVIAVFCCAEMTDTPPVP